MGFTLIPHGFAVPPSPVRGKAAYRTDCGARPPGRAILLRLQAISKAAPPTHCIFQIFVGLACACGMGRNLV